MKNRRVLFPALVFFFFFFFIQSWLQLASAHTKCPDNGKYTLNSTYAVNLNDSLTILSRDVSDTGFFSTTAGDGGADRAYAVVLCGGDAQLEACRKCIRESPDQFLLWCPNRKQAIRWEDLCMVRYSDAPIYGVMATEPKVNWGKDSMTVSNATSPEQFGVVLRSLLDELRKRASSGGPLRKVAARSVTGPDNQAIYAMVQCTPDLSQEDCDECLIIAYSNIAASCDGKRVCRVLSPSCNFRYEKEPFYSDTRLRELETVSSLSPPPAPSSGKGSSKTRTVMIIVAPTILSFILAISAIVWLRKRKAQKPTEPHHDNIGEITTPESLQYAFSKIKFATDGFSDNNKLGQGGFGFVYKGKLPNGLEIAVKRLSMNSGQGDLEFKNEVLLLAKLQHRNLVRLLGFAIEGTEKLLIYELVQNSSLDKFIFDETSRSYLDWDRRYKIIGGIARGILYLHEDSRLKIIHRDLKPSNILLDGEMNPKIADFGMARLFGQDETQQNTSRVVGTYGYMPSEYILHGQFSTKSDVFSFGVLVLEIICGRKNNNFRSRDNADDLLTFVWRNWREGTAAIVVEPSLRGSTSEMLRCIHIGLLCIQENAAERPTMASVVIMLSSSSIGLPLPSAPAFYFPTTEIPQLHDDNSGAANRIIRPSPTMRSQSPNSIHDDDF